MAKRYSQPQQPVGVDWSNPITRGLQVAFNGSQYLSVTPTGIVSPSFDTRPTARAGKAGIATAGDGASTSTYHAIPQSTTGEFTLFVLAEQYSQLTDRRIIALTNSGDTSTVAIGTGVSDASKARLWTNIAVCDLTTTPQIFAAGTVSSVAVSVNNAASSIRFFANGAFDQSYANSINVTTRNRISFGSLRRTTNGSVFNGGVYLGLYFNRALSDAEIKSLSDNPWQIFQPTNRAIYPEAAGSTYTLTADAASYSITGADASLIVNRKLIADTANIPIAGADATLTYTPIGGPTYTLTADAGSYAITGNATGLAFNRVLTADAGSYNVAGQAVGLAFNRVLSAATANIPVAGQDVTLTYTNNGFTYTLSAEAGAFSVTGQDARLVWSGEQTTYSGGYEHLGRRQTPKQRKEQRQRLGIIAQDIKEATKKVARAVIADTGRTDPVSHFEDHKAQFLQMLVDELKGYQPPDMADVISRQIRIAYAIQEQEEEELLLLLH